jgi:hypothetical protein
MIKLSAKTKAFSKNYNADWEDEAHAQRGEFLERFPIANLAGMRLTDYAIGQNEGKSFCYWVEPGTRKWAGIVGSTARKFGVYYGKEGADKTLRYRYTKKFAHNLPSIGAETKAFKNIRNELVELIRAGENLNFSQIDSNPLSQMFKAKILSLYYPDRYLAICSAEHLLNLAKKLRLNCSSPSRIQNETIKAKTLSSDTAKWTNLKYAAFMYREVLGLTGGASATNEGETKHREVDFEKLMQVWQALGKKSEEFALTFERRRLRSTGMASLATKIADRTKAPGYGYDFESFNSPNVKRYIEVKTLTHISDNQSRFFVSENERKKSQQDALGKNYYFYLVVYDSSREPVEVRVMHASELYRVATLDSQNYLVKLSRSANGL